MKQLFLKSIILAIFSIISIKASAVEVDGIYYNLDETAMTAEVTSGSTKYSGAVTIPSTIGYKRKKYSVTSIGDCAFQYCTGLTSVIIPVSVISIGKNVFYRCSGLTSVTIGNHVASIGMSAFESCTGLTSITIPNSVMSINEAAFQNCSSLTSVTIGNSVTCIGNYAFADCTSLTSITIPNSVTSIENSAFFRCTGLTSVTIPNSVTSIGEEAFMECGGLTSIVIPASVTTIEGYTFQGCTGLTSIEFLDGVTSIGDGMFFDCTGLTSVTIPNSVTSIGNHAFSCCLNLTSISIGNNVTSIGMGAFESCTGLTSITIPNSVRSIGNNVFRFCDNLTSVTSLITDVFETDIYAFESCGNATLYVPKGLVSIYQSTADWNRFGKIKEIAHSYDLNNDGSTDISDVVTLVNAILSSSTIDDSYDVNGDGSVDISDVVALVNVILNGTGTGSDDNSQTYLTCPDNNHPHMIDLGLPSGTKWACCNVGADKPEAYGGYYAWGETEEKSDYTYENYAYYNNSTGSFNIGPDISGTQYDVAHVKWGGGWCMPTNTQIQELLDNTISEGTYQKGVTGIKFMGSNGGTIFLPAAGCRCHSDLDDAGYTGHYWSSSLSVDDEDYTCDTCELHINYYFAELARNYYEYGLSVRPVRPVAK